MLTVITQAQGQRAPEIIYNQPEGELKLYQREGYQIKEDEENNTFNVIGQSDMMSIVFGDNHEVYMLDPVSGYTLGGSWVKGTLNDEGNTITIPVGQYVDYTRTFDMAYQMVVLSLDKESNTYVTDATVTEVTYTIDANGVIIQNGLSQERILGLIIRTFGNPQGSAIGQDFFYLNGEWLGSGDFGSVYKPSGMQVAQPPVGLETESYYLTTASFNGVEYTPHQATVEVANDQDKEEVWIKGLSQYLPNAWAKGAYDNGHVVIPSGSFLGTLEGIPLYLHGASLDASSNFHIKDIELTLEDGQYVTYDFVFFTTSATALEYVNFYMGVTLSKNADTAVEAPEGLLTQRYTMAYQNNSGQNFSKSVLVGFTGDEVYLQGLWSSLPSAWVKGHIDGSQIILNMPQYLGSYTDSYTKYPIYATAFNEQNGELYRQLIFDYNAEDGTLTASTAISIGINKTGYLSVQDYYSVVLTNDAMTGIDQLAISSDQSATTYYDMQGRRTGSTQRGLLIQKTRQADGRGVIRKATR